MAPKAIERDRLKLPNPKLRKRLLLILTLVGSSGCQSTSGGCPPLVNYTVDQQLRAARELRSLPKGSQLAQFVTDYGSFAPRAGFDARATFRSAFF